jgi:hypothetical protein
MKYLLILLFLAQPLAAQTFPVIHEKTFWRDGHGTIEITDEGIRYASDKAKDSRSWSYQDIQSLDRISSKEFTILSYEDESRYLGRDKSYHFVITEGELTDELFRKISEKMGRPVTDRVVPDNIAVQYRIPVKHLHTFGGCEGILEFTGDSIIYATKHKADAREWKLSRDVQSVWSSDRYQLEIHVYENNRREFSRTRIYKFALKTPLDPEIYRSLKLKLYDLEADHSPIQRSAYENPGE